MTDDTEARAIAARLTKAQREALLACEALFEPHPRPSWAFKEAWRRYMFQLRDKGLMHPANRDARHRLTMLGLRVRAALVEMEARHD